MKAYQEKFTSYRNKCQSLEKDKESLKNDKRQLEWEVFRLKEQLDTFSIASHSSVFNFQKSHSWSSVNEVSGISSNKST